MTPEKKTVFSFKLLSVQLNKLSKLTQAQYSTAEHHL